ncbi:MAG TPA: 2,3,4,5-tetrahydropyridine-2,6-dicarboxylate N-succinyltransferase [Rectinemataceae bacterium]|nr:2,3,4,5-tetrahydropyridine-2,6-dicarboxylate N-succinyltransferase [Rectinemataceae bacterium]
MSAKDRPMTAAELARFFSRPMEDILADGALIQALPALLSALEAGSVRAAERAPDGSWNAIVWVKTGILAGFRSTAIVPFAEWPGGAADKSAFPPRHLAPIDEVRMVPGGSSVRSGVRLGKGVVIMPPAYINVGAWVGEGTMVDSHALVGSCAQVGSKVHLSAGAQIGGVLEPAGARPVVVEDGAFIGALCGLVEGVIVRSRAVLAPGTILSASTTIYDLVKGVELRGEVPSGAVVVPGSRPAKGNFAIKRGISLYAPCIVKYRDEGTDAATVLEEALR